jgi:long-chain acyl-CoA synthetase
VGKGTVPGLLAARAAAEPDRIAIEVIGNGSVTCAEWDSRATAVARGLIERGLAPRDRVVLRYGARNWIEYAVAYCGVQRAGGVAVPCSDRLVPAQVERIVGQCSAFGVLGPSRGGSPGLSVWNASIAEVFAEGSDDLGRTVRGEDIAQILYTSGTTGVPKGVAATHANMTFGSGGTRRRRPLAHSDLFLHAFPVGTNAAQSMLLNALDARPGALVVPRFTPERFARAASRPGVGTLFAVPAMAMELLASGALGRHDLSGVRLFGSTAAALPAAVASALAAELPGAVIVNYYTSTEAWPAQLSMIFDPTRPDSVGRAVEGRVRILGPEGDLVPAGEPGDVWLRAPHPRSYVGDATATRATFRAGWVRMGDVGRLDADGYLYLLDRDEDVIKTGADKVSTLAVENAVHCHPAVAEVAVLGTPHPVLGQAVAAAVVVRPSYRTPTLAELRGFLADRLARHELPGHLLVVDELPRNAAGKVRKKDLVPRFSGPARPRPAGPDHGAAGPVKGE